MGLRGALQVYPDPPACLGHLDPVLTSFCSPDSGVTPAPSGVTPAPSGVALMVARRQNRSDASLSDAAWTGPRRGP